jgi:hypothetical protein
MAHPASNSCRGCIHATIVLGIGRSSSKVTDRRYTTAAEDWGCWEAPGAAQGEEESTGREAAV